MVDQDDFPRIDRSIYRYVLRHTWRGQAFLLLLTVVTMPLVYVSLEIPKRIVNQAIGGTDLPQALFGFEISQIEFLMLLSVAFLLAVILTGGLKYYLNVFKGVLGERMLRRFRFDLYARILRFPAAHIRKTPSAELIPMITAETEPLGGLIGDAIAAPAFQGALLLTYLSFIFQQDFWLGVASIALYPPQMILIPRLQAKVNALSRARVQNVRKLAGHIGETVDGVVDIHANDAGRFERAKTSSYLGRIFDIREEIYRRKFFIKFLNNFLAQVTPFFFFAIGGYLVIQGDVSLGALVAVLAAYKDIGPPWKELLKFYQVFEDTKVKYLQVAEQFEPANMIRASLLESQESVGQLTGPLVGRNVSTDPDDGIGLVANVSFELDLDRHIALVGKPGSGAGDVSKIAARLAWPLSGEVMMGTRNWSETPEAITGRRVAWVGSSSHIFAGTLAHNLYYGLMTAPQTDGVQELDSTQRRNRREAVASGNSLDDPEGNWLRAIAGGEKDPETTTDRVVEILKATELWEDVYRLGLGARIQQFSMSAEVREKILAARKQLSASRGDLQQFDRDRYDPNLTVAENILFGYAVDSEFSQERLPGNDIVSDVLRETDLFDAFLLMGYRVAQAMTEIFSGLQPDDELLQRFSLVTGEDLENFERILRNCPREDLPALTALTDTDQHLLRGVVFRLIPAQHRLGIIDTEVQERLLAARNRLFEKLGSDNPSVAFFDPNEICPALSVEGNILFGSIPYGKPREREAISRAIDDLVIAEGLGDYLIALGLSREVGAAGNRLSSVQRQKLAFARALLKEPDLLVVDQALMIFDAQLQSRMLDSIRQLMSGRGVLWVLESPAMVTGFDEVWVMQSGKIIERGKPTELASSNSELQRLIAMT